jgi:regulatory protein
MAADLDAEAGVVPRAASAGRSGRSGPRRPTGAGADEPTDSYAAARSAVLRALTASAKSRGQLTDLLRRRGIDDGVIEEVLDRYTEVGLVDDAAFAEAWVRSRAAGRGLGRRALQHELRAKGISDDLAETALRGLDDEAERARARALVQSRARLLAGLPFEARLRRLTGLLQRKGYSGDLALRVVREVLAEFPANAESPADDPDAGPGADDV